MASLARISTAPLQGDKSVLLPHKLSQLTVRHSSNSSVCTVTRCYFGGGALSYWGVPHRRSGSDGNAPTTTGHVARYEERAAASSEELPNLRFATTT